MIRLRVINESDCHDIDERLISFRLRIMGDLIQLEVDVNDESEPYVTVLTIDTSTRPVIKMTIPHLPAWLQKHVDFAK